MIYHDTTRDAGQAALIVLLKDCALGTSSHARILGEKPIPIGLGSFYGLIGSAIPAVRELPGIYSILALKADQAAN